MTGHFQTVAASDPDNRHWWIVLWFVLSLWLSLLLMSALFQPSGKVKQSLFRFMTDFCHENIYTLQLCRLLMPLGIIV